MERLEKVCARVGDPIIIRVGNGRAFISLRLDLRPFAKPVTPDVLGPGKPTDKGIIKAFNRKGRAGTPGRGEKVRIGAARQLVNSRPSTIVPQMASIRCVAWDPK